MGTPDPMQSGFQLPAAYRWKKPLEDGGKNPGLRANRFFFFLFSFLVRHYHGHHHSKLPNEENANIKTQV